MKKDLEQKLFNDFPKMFPNVFKAGYPPVGLQIEDGWFALIYKLCADLETEAKRVEMSDAMWPRVIQCKEKFGTLRFNVANDIGNPQFDEEPSVFGRLFEIIEVAEEHCKTICADCGAPGKLYREQAWRVHCKSCEVIYQRELGER
ncbi:MAG: hypothetical protein H7Z73_05405 [Candidatus Saccharibacteria bacterium]|nr:hypothetical protein [Moraxellaceae bacterium]